MKVPKARKLPSGTWFIQLRLGGESIPVTASTEKECTHKAQLIKAKYLADNSREKRDTSDITLGQMLDKYIAKKKNASPATLRGYNIIRKNRMQKYMDTPVKNIRNWQHIYDEESQEYSPKTMMNEWSLVRSAYEYVFGKSLPEVEKVPLIKKEHKFLEPEQITKFVAAVKDTNAAIPAMLALHSLRASEIADLKWEDIDFKKETIFVNGAAVYDKDNKLVHKDENKTDDSRRYVTMLIPELKEALLAAQQPSGYVVTVRPNTVYRRIAKVYESAGLPNVGVHGLRHSFASLCYSLEVPPKVTMALGGWSNYQTVMDIYTHLDKKNIGKQTKKLKQFYAKKKAGKKSRQ